MKCSYQYKYNASYRYGGGANPNRDGFLTFLLVAFLVWFSLYVCNRAIDDYFAHVCHYQPYNR